MRKIAISAVIAAFYVVAAFATFASGYIRISEALCVLPFFTPYAVYGLFVGCVITNLIAGGVIFDIVFGSLATLVAALCTYYIGVAFRKLRVHSEKSALCNVLRFLAPLPAVIINAFVVGAILVYAYGYELPYFIACLYVFLGQTVSCYIIGMPLLFTIEKKLPMLFT